MSGGTNIEHVWLSTERSDDVDGTPFRSARLGAQVRSLLYPLIYLPPCPSTAITETATTSGLSLANVQYKAVASTPPTTAATNTFRIGRATMDYTLIPRAKRGFSTMACALLACQSDDKEALELAESTGALTAARKVLERRSCLPDTGGTADRRAPTGELIFAGTGAAMPCKHRNVTGMLLRQADGRSLLLDVGEGTLGQLLRAETGRQGTKDLLSNIKAAWISHPHADHHLGLLRLLTDRDPTDALLLLAPSPIFRFLEEYAELVPSIRGTYRAIDSNLLTQHNIPMQNQIRSALGVTSCRSVPVAHCAHAYALIVEGTSFGRIVYSGDCRPSYPLAQAALGADLLIHEATFEDGMEAEAALKKHSTVGEALAIGRAMQCRCVVLTHFSQRYPKIPPTPAGDGEYAFPIIFAFDSMRLWTHNLLVASELTPALRLLFPESDDDKEDHAKSVSTQALSIPGLFAVSNLL
jgi:ribonuclease Z